MEEEKKADEAEIKDFPVEETPETGATESVETSAV